MGNDAELGNLESIPAGTTVLLVDDNIQNLELIQAYLEELGCEVRAVTGSAEAIEDVAVKAPDLVVLDVMMPRMSGFQLCEELRRMEATRETPVILVTALSEAGDVERGLESGANDFLTKPVDRVELLTRVRAQLKVRALDRRVRELVERARTLDPG